MMKLENKKIKKLIKWKEKLNKINDKMIIKK